VSNSPKVKPACARNAANRIDLDALHARHIDQDATVAYRTASDVVATGANGDEEVS
jgi:hypothetical protein